MKDSKDAYTVENEGKIEPDVIEKLLLGFSVVPEESLVLLEIRVDEDFQQITPLEECLYTH